MSNHTTPRILVLCRYFLERVAKQRSREAKLQLVDYLILLLAGACLGSIKKQMKRHLGHLVTLTPLLQCLLGKITITEDKDEWWWKSDGSLKEFSVKQGCQY